MLVIIVKYQPSGEGGTGSPLVTLHCVKHRTNRNIPPAANSKWTPGDPKMA